MNKRSVTIFTKPELYDGMTMITILCDNISDGSWVTVLRNGEEVASFDSSSILGWAISEPQHEVKCASKYESTDCTWK